MFVAVGWDGNKGSDVLHLMGVVLVHSASLLSSDHKWAFPSVSVHVIYHWKVGTLI